MRLSQRAALPAGRDMQLVIGQRCECEGCEHCKRNENERCRNLHGQKDLFSENVIELYQLEEKSLCAYCLPKPIVKPVNLDWKTFNREKERLEKQDTLFDFR